MRPAARPRYPRAYRKLDAKNWTVGVSAGVILLGATIAVLKRAVFDAVDRHVEREENLDRSHVRIGPGDMMLEEFEVREAENYVLIVKPHEAPCRAAVAKVGELGGPPPDRVVVMRQLRAEGVEADRGRQRTLEGKVERGRYAWAVWHDQPKPVRVFIHYQDTRR